MKIQIISLPRSGSSYLRSMIDAQLNDLDNYFSISEPFNHSKNHKLKPNEIIDKIKNNKNVLVKTMIFEKRNEDFNSLFDYTICLTRRNLFEATLSRMIALETKNWDNPHDEKTKVSFDFEYYKIFLNETKFWNKQLLKFSNCNLLYYEDLSFDSLIDINKLSIPIEHKNNYKTCLLYCKKDIVLNYEELREKTEKYLK